MKQLLCRLAGVLVVCLATGCYAPEPQIIIQTRMVERPDCDEIVVEVTRVVRDVVVVTATPRPLTATPPPPTLRFGVLSGGGAEVSPPLATRLNEALGRHAGFACEVVVLEHEADLVGALCTGQVDVAWLSVPAYLVASSACSVEVAFGAIQEGAAPARAQILVQSEAARTARGLKPIQTLVNLDGRVVAFTDPDSITGYLVPKAMLAEAGARPGEELFVGGEMQAVLAIYKGEVDAAVISWQPSRADGSPGDARGALLSAYPDVAQAIKVLRLSDALPNNPLVLRRGLPPEVRARLLAALLDLPRSEQGLVLLEQWGQTTGLAPVSDRDYDVLRTAGSTLSVDWGRVLTGRLP